jgi:putative tricarboxylic transport membrane protein
MLTLGIPGDSSTAIMLGAIMLQGLNPGVTLFRDSPTLTYGMITGLFTSTIFMVIISFLAVKPFVAMLNRDRSWIFPFVLIFSCIGAYATSNSVFPVTMSLVFGVIAYFMAKHGFPLVTMVLAIILGPVIETNARLALIFSSGSISTFYSTWPRVLIILVILYLVISELIGFIKRNKVATQN